MALYSMDFDEIFVALALLLILYFYGRKLSFFRVADEGKCVEFRRSEVTPKAKSVNYYHLTRRSNAECGFCFRTTKTSYMFDLESAKHKLKLLKDAGMEKIKFSGGEPFLPNRSKHLGQLVKYCKTVLELSSVSIVSNGSLITKKWFQIYGKYVDIMAVSCDSFNEDTNKVIGGGQGNRNHLEKILQVRDWCHQYKVLFKINTLVNTYNKDEDMGEEIQKINPIRWKVFQCLLLEGENGGPDARRNAERCYIDDKIFESFLERHKHIKCLVPISYNKMQKSYLIIDGYMRFLDWMSGSKIPSTILDVRVQNALQFSGFV